GLDDGQGTLIRHYCYSPVASDIETLAAPAFALHVRVAKLEGLVQALLDEIDLGAVDQLEAFGVDDDLHAAVFEHHIARVDLVRVVDQIRPARAAGALHADTQADALAALVEIALDPASRVLGQ